MLKIPAPFPQVGSYALLIDSNLPPSLQRAELVRVERLPLDSGAGVTVSFPLREGASGRRIVEAAELIDGTPLGREEQRELADIQRHLAGRERLTPRLKAMQRRGEALRRRAIFSLLLESELAKLRERDARQVRRDGGSVGLSIPREAAA